jgi:hypothetical protein
MQRMRVQNFGVISRREGTADIINNIELEARAVMWEIVERIKRDKYLGFVAILKTL